MIFYPQFGKYLGACVAWEWRLCMVSASGFPLGGALGYQLVDFLWEVR